MPLKLEVDFFSKNLERKKRKDRKKRRGIQRTVSNLTKAAEKFGVPVKIGCDLRRLNLNDLPEYRQGGNGYISLAQAYTLFSLITEARGKGRKLDVKYKPGDKFVIVGSMQLGKSGIICAAFFILPLLQWLSTGEKCVPVITIPSSHSLRTQFDADLAPAYKVFSNITFEANGKKTTVGEFYSTIFPNKNMCGDDFVFNRSCSNVAAFRKKLRQHSEKSLVMQFGDEIHWGQDVNGVSHKMDKDYEDKIVQFGISATPSEQLAQTKDSDSQWVRIPAYVDKNYTGPRRWMGMELPSVDDTYEEVLPQLHSHLDFFGRLEMDTTAFKANFQCFRNPEEWAEKSNGGVHPSPATMKAAQKWCEAAVDALIADLRTVYKKRPGGVFLRILNNTPMTKWIIKRIEGVEPPLNIHAKIIHFYNEKKGGRQSRLSVKETIKKALGGKKDANYLVIAVAKARMGDSFPTSCRTFIDLTRGNDSHFNAMCQGTYGRACGYNKQSLVVLSNVFAERMRRFLANGCSHIGKRCGRKYSTRVHADHVHGPGRISKQFVLYAELCKGDPVLEVFLSDVEEARQNFGIRLREEHGQDFYQMFRAALTEDVFVRLEEKFHRQFQRWDMPDTWLSNPLNGVTLRYAGFDDQKRNSDTYDTAKKQYRDVQKESAAKHDADGVYEQVVWYGTRSGKKVLCVNLRLVHTEPYYPQGQPLAVHTVTNTPVSRYY